MLHHFPYLRARMRIGADFLRPFALPAVVVGLVLAVLCACPRAGHAQALLPLYVAEHRANRVDRITFSAPGVLDRITPFATGVEGPRYLALDPSGNLYVTTLDFNNPVIGPDRTIVKVTPGGAVSTFATGFQAPYGLAFDRFGNLYVADTNAGVIEKITFSAPGTLGSQTTFASGLVAPYGLAFDASGNLFVSSYTTSGSVSKITFSAPGAFGGISTFATGLVGPSEITFDEIGNLYVAETGPPGPSQGQIITRITPNGVASTFASGGGLSGPVGLAYDGQGHLYVSNAVSNITGSTISEISFSAPGTFGGITTFASNLPGPFGLAFPVMPAGSGASVPEPGPSALVVALIISAALIIGRLPLPWPRRQQRIGRHAR